MKFFLRLGTKLIFAVSMASLVIIGVFAYLSINSQRDVLIGEVQRHAYQLSETIKNSTREEMLQNSRANIIRIINQISNEPSIKEINIFNKAGEVIYSNNPKRLGVKLNQSDQNCIVCHSNEIPATTLKVNDKTRIFRMHPDSARVIGIINPIYNENTCSNAECHAHSSDQSILGLLDVTVDLKNIDHQIANSEILIVILACVSILSLGLVLLILVYRWVNKPIKAMIFATDKISIGNFNFRINAKSSDELGRLANSIDEMTKKLSEMKLQLLQSDKLASLGQLAAGIAHEINNPLTGVLTYSSFLLKRAKDNPELESDLNVIVRETKRSREIIKQLLDFARQSSPQVVKSNINNLLERVIRITKNELMIKHVEVETEFDPEIPDVYLDPNQIQQVILNLIVNAIHAVDEFKGKIKFKTSKSYYSPVGIVHMDEALCPNGHSLIDKERKIGGLPSVRVLAIYGQNEGYIHLDPTYGLQRHQYGIKVLKDKPFELFCPECRTSLMDQDNYCPQCRATCYKLNIPSKGELLGCSKFGGNWQKWDYMDRKGKSEFIEIVISDNGKGIPNELIENIFDPFFTTKGQQGTGLGLSVAWGIIENHKGTIEVESIESKGTKFTIKLPITKNIFE